MALPPKADKKKSTVLPLPPKAEKKARKVVITFVNEEPEEGEEVDYTITYENSKLAINEKEMVLTPYEELEGEQQDVYAQYARPPNWEPEEEGERATPQGRPGRALFMANFDAFRGDLPDVEGNGSMMALFDAIADRLYDGKPLASHYVINGFRIWVQGHENEAQTLPYTGSALMNFDFDKLLTTLNHY